MDKGVVVIIMAGGLGKRMSSDTPKVLHKLRNIPMINHILLTLKQLGNIVKLEKIIVVVGKYKDQIVSVIEELGVFPNIVYVTQLDPQGTGHAIMCCKNELLKYPENDVLILSGDVPLLSINTMQNILDMNCDVKIISANLDDPNGYGRILLKDDKFYKIIEQKDCTEEEVQISRVNCGIYCIKSELLIKYLSYLKNDNKQSEYYLTDIIEIIKTRENLEVGVLTIEKYRIHEIIGVNTIQQLVELEEIMEMKEMMG